MDQNERNCSAERPLLAYKNEKFLDAPDARSLRILSEYLYPLSQFRKEKVLDTIVFFGSARTPEQGPNARYYHDARELARRITEWSDHRRTRRADSSCAAAAVRELWRRPIAGLMMQE